MLGEWAHGYIDTNPAGESIDAALVPMPKVKAHHRALPYRELPTALQTIWESKAVKASKLALEFLALTASRSGKSGARNGKRLSGNRPSGLFPLNG